MRKKCARGLKNGYKCRRYDIHFSIIATMVFFCLSFRSKTVRNKINAERRGENEKKKQNE